MKQLQNQIISTYPAVSQAYQDHYDTLYSSDNAAFEKNRKEWENLVAERKAVTIASLCKDLRFKNVLDCGAGTGALANTLSKMVTFDHEKIYAIEIAKKAVKKIRERNIRNNHEVKAFDGYKIPYDDKFFDLVICNHVMEHVEHPRLLLREIKRVSRHQVFEVPLDYRRDIDSQYKKLAEYGHINIFTPSLFRFLLKSEGFSILRERHTNILRESEIKAFNWFNNLGYEPTIERRLRLVLSPLVNLLRNLFRGDEYGYSEYSCLATSNENFEIKFTTSQLKKVL